MLNDSDINATVRSPSGTDAIHGAFVVLDQCLIVCVVLFGLGGNSLTIRVLRCPQLANTSTAFYFTALAMVDILVLLVGPTLKATSAFVYGSDKHVRDSHAAACKILLFLNYSLSQISAWVLVAVTVDRAVWVLLPFSARLLCTTRRAGVAVCAIVLVICSVNARHLWTPRLQLREDGRGSVCFVNDTFTDTYVTYVDPALVTILPFLIMLTANLLILRKMRRVRRKRQTSLNKTDGHSGRRPGSNLTRMLVGASVFYLVSSLPYLVLMLVLRHARRSIVASPQLVNVVFCVQVFCYTLFTLNYAIHFLLYCLTGPTFKAEALRVLRVRRARRQSSRRDSRQQSRQPAVTRCTTLADRAKEEADDDAEEDGEGERHALSG